MEDVLRLMSNVIVPGAHGHMFCSDLTFCHKDESFRAAKEEIEDVEGDLAGEKEKVSEIFEVRDQALLYIKRLEVYNLDSRPRDLFHASVSEMGILF